MKSTAPLEKKKKAQIIIFLIVWEKHIVILSYFIHSLEVILLADIRVRKTCVHVKFIISWCVWNIV